MLTREHILAEQSQFTQAAKALATTAIFADNISTQSAVDAALAPITGNPYSVTAGHAIASLWKIIPAMYNVEAASTLDAAVQ